MYPEGSVTVSANVSQGNAIPSQRGPVSSWPRPTGDWFAWTNGPAVYSSVVAVSDTVPDGGVAAKLESPSTQANEQRIKAKKMRGLNAPDSETDFFRMVVEWLSANWRTRFD